jgi:hypothetical protein
MGKKAFVTPENAVETFIKCKKENKEVPESVFESLRNYKTWSENSLKGLLNASAYYPDILFEENMEQGILAHIQKFKDRIVPSRIF